MNTVEQEGVNDNKENSIRQEYTPLIQKVLSHSSTSLYYTTLGLTKSQILQLVQEFYETDQRQDPDDNDGFRLFDDRLREMIYATKFPQYLSPYFEGCDANTSWVLDYMFSPDVLKTHPNFLKGYFDYIQRFYYKMLGKNYSNFPRKSVIEYLQCVDPQFLVDHIIPSMIDFASHDKTNGGQIVLGLVKHNISQSVEAAYDVSYDDITTEQICCYNLLVFLIYGHNIFTNDLMVGDALPLINPKTKEVHMAYYNNSTQSF